MVLNLSMEPTNGAWLPGQVATLDVYYGMDYESNPGPRPSIKMLTYSNSLSSELLSGGPGGAERPLKHLQATGYLSV